MNRILTALDCNFFDKYHHSLLVAFEINVLPYLRSQFLLQSEHPCFSVPANAA